LSRKSNCTNKKAFWTPFHCRAKQDEEDFQFFSSSFQKSVNFKKEKGDFWGYGFG
jgi:hypothetical protein